MPRPRAPVVATAVTFAIVTGSLPARGSMEAIEQAAAPAANIVPRILAADTVDAEGEDVVGNSTDDVLEMSLDSNASVTTTGVSSVTTSTATPTSTSTSTSSASSTTSSTSTTTIYCAAYTYLLAELRRARKTQADCYSTTTVTTTTITSTSTSTSTTTAGCLVWCPRSPRSWSTKCAWTANCAACTQCQGNNIEVALDMMLENLEYASLMENVTLLDSVSGVLANAFAEASGDGVGAGHVAISFATGSTVAGSVQAAARVNPPLGIAPSAVVSSLTLSSFQLAMQATEMLQQLPGIDDISTGTVAVNWISSATIRIPTPTTSPTPTPSETPTPSPTPLPPGTAFSTPSPAPTSEELDPANDTAWSTTSPEASGGEEPMVNESTESARRILGAEQAGVEWAGAEVVVAPRVLYVGNESGANESSEGSEEDGWSDANQSTEVVPVGPLQPTPVPSAPTPKPTPAPTPDALSQTPTPTPTMWPTESLPTSVPTRKVLPSPAPTPAMALAPTPLATLGPTLDSSPVIAPSLAPTRMPTGAPTATPTESPSRAPTAFARLAPTEWMSSPWTGADPVVYSCEPADLTTLQDWEVWLSGELEVCVNGTTTTTTTSTSLPPGWCAGHMAPLDGTYASQTTCDYSMPDESNCSVACPSEGTIAIGEFVCLQGSLVGVSLCAPSNGEVALEPADVVLGGFRVQLSRDPAFSEIQKSLARSFDVSTDSVYRVLLAVAGSRRLASAKFGRLPTPWLQPAEDGKADADLRPGRRLQGVYDVDYEVAVPPDHSATALLRKASALTVENSTSQATFLDSLRLQGISATVLQQTTPPRAFTGAVARGSDGKILSMSSPEVLITTTSVTTTSATTTTATTSTSETTTTSTSYNWWPGTLPLTSAAPTSSLDPSVLLRQIHSSGEVVKQLPEGEDDGPGGIRIKSEDAPIVILVCVGFILLVVCLVVVVRRIRSGRCRCVCSAPDFRGCVRKGVALFASLLLAAISCLFGLYSIWAQWNGQGPDDGADKEACAEEDAERQEEAEEPVETVDIVIDGQYYTSKDEDGMFPEAKGMDKQAAADMHADVADAAAICEVAETSATPNAAEDACGLGHAAVADAEDKRERPEVSAMRNGHPNESRGGSEDSKETLAAAAVGTPPIAEVGPEAVLELQHDLFEVGFDAKEAPPPTTVPVIDERPKPTNSDQLKAVTPGLIVSYPATASRGFTVPEASAGLSPDSRQPQQATVADLVDDAAEDAKANRRLSPKIPDSVVQALPESGEALGAMFSVSVEDPRDTDVQAAGIERQPLEIQSHAYGSACASCEYSLFLSSEASSPVARSQDRPLASRSSRQPSEPDAGKSVAAPRPLEPDKRHGPGQSSVEADETGVGVSPRRDAADATASSAPPRASGNVADRAIGRPDAGTRTGEEICQPDTGEARGDLPPDLGSGKGAGDGSLEANGEKPFSDLNDIRSL